MVVLNLSSIKIRKHRYNIYITMVHEKAVITTNLLQNETSFETSL